MDGGKNIIWLASYPKSGNTWFRAFLTALQNGGKVDINQMSTSGIYSAKEIFETITDTDSDELTRAEIQFYNRIVHRYRASTRDGAQKMFIKIHDAFTFDEAGSPLIPEDVTHCAVYFVRNPLDVAISFANHNNQSVAKTISKSINNPKGSLASAPYANQFPQLLLDWGGHVASWLDRPQFPVYVLRYEDMKSNTFNVFREVVKNIGLAYSDDEIRNAIAASSFEALKQQEETKGFKEKMPASPRFFNAGIVGNWKQKLTEEQVESIIQHHAPMMQRLRYL